MILPLDHHSQREIQISHSIRFILVGIVRGVARRVSRIAYRVSHVARTLDLVYQNFEIRQIRSIVEVNRDLSNGCRAYRLRQR